MKKAAIYARRSRDDNKNESIPGQIELAQLEADRLDLAIVEESIYIDDAISGHGAERPCMDRLMEDAKSGVFDVLLVKNLSRFGRQADTDDARIAELRSIGVTTRLILDGQIVAPYADPKNPTVAEKTQDLLTLRFLSGMNELNWWQIRENMTRGKQRSARQGHYAGGEVPYGLSSVVCNRHPGCTKKILVENPDEIAWLRDVYDWLVNEGVATYEVAKRLNDRGIRPRRWLPEPTEDELERLQDDPKKLRLRLRRSEMVWTQQLIRHALRNPRLTGRTRSWNADQKIPTIFDATEFSRLQMALDRTRNVYSSVHVERAPYPLSRRIWEPDRDHYWTGGKRKGKRWYKCRHYPNCDWHVRRWIGADDFETAVLRAIGQAFMPDPDGNFDLVDQIAEQLQDYGDEFDQADLDTARREADDAERELAEAALSWVRIDLDPAAMKLAKQTLQDDLDAKRERVAALETASLNARLGEEWFQQFTGFNLKEGTWGELMELWRALDERTGLTELTSEVQTLVTEGKLERLLSRLDLRVRLTGRHTADLESGISFGPATVNVKLGGFTF